MQNKMIECRVCQHKIKKTWNYCPKCGGKIKEEEYPFVKLNYMWERERSGQFIYDNFKAVSRTGDFAYNKIAPIRKTLGDLIHINFYNLRKFALLNFSPKFTLELFKISKLTGYYDGELGLRCTGLKEKSVDLTRTEKFLDIFRELNEKRGDHDGYFNLGCGILELKEVDEVKNRVVYTLDENTNYPVKSTKRVCYEDLGVLYGWIESLTGRFGRGVETRCHCVGDSLCEFEMHVAKRDEEPKIKLLTKTEAEDILNNLVRDAVHKRHIINRKTLGDYTYMGYDQCMNYLLTHSSKGHEALSVYCGRRIGEKIGETAKLADTKEALTYLRGLFEYMKVGLISEKEVKGESATIRLLESVYSSGVNNIHMKLDTFMAGIIKGALNEATNKKWLVDETKCLANGDNHCEFTCKTR